MSDVGQTDVRENARWEVLRGLKLVRECFERTGLKGPVPLFEAEWENALDDIWLAAQEAGKLGDITFRDVSHPDNPAHRMIITMRGGHDAMVWITEQGIRTIAVHDALNEARQEGEMRTVAP